MARRKPDEAEQPKLEAPAEAYAEALSAPQGEPEPLPSVPDEAEQPKLEAPVKCFRVKLGGGGVMLGAILYEAGAHLPVTSVPAGLEHMVESY